MSKKIDQELATAMQALTTKALATRESGQNQRKYREAIKVDPKPIIDRLFSDYQTFDEQPLVEALRAAKNFCVAMATDSAPDYWLSLLGPSGTGKTMLARKCVKFFKDNLDFYLDERFDPAIERSLRKGGVKPWVSAISDMVNGDYSGLRNLKADWLVCLDDIMAEYSRHKELSVAKLYEVLSAREGKFTIITANIGLDEIGSRMDVRISSRLLRNEAVVVEVQAEDFNKRLQ